MPYDLPQKSVNKTDLLCTGNRSGAFGGFVNNGIGLRCRRIDQLITADANDIQEFFLDSFNRATGKGINRPVDRNKVSYRTENQVRRPLSLLCFIQKFIEDLGL